MRTPQQHCVQQRTYVNITYNLLLQWVLLLFIVAVLEL
jgi:hypothetical protein